MEPKNKKPRIPPPLYPCPTQHEKYYSKKKVFSEKYIDYESFPKYPISQCFAGKNMIKSLLHISGRAPISPVLLFYSQIHNLSEEDQSFDTCIEGRIHTITPQVIASLLGFDRPLKPVSFPPTNEDELVVSKDEFRCAVYLPEHVNSYGRHPKSEIKISQLKPIIAVLVKICQSNILPAFSHHYFTNLNSIYLSFLLLNGYQVDISHVIWHTMAHLDRGRTKAVPYGIIVGQLLSYLGHPFPDDTPCTSDPGTFDVKFLCRNRVPYPRGSNGKPLSEPHSDDISPPLPPPSTDNDDASELPLALPKDPRDSNDRPLSEPHSDGIVPPLPPSTDCDGASELPLALPNDPPAKFVSLSESIQLLKGTMEVVFSRFEQQHEQFMQQKKNIAHQQDHLQRQHEEFGQQQKLIIDGIVTRQDHFIAHQDDRLEQQHEAFMQQKKTIEHIGHQQDHLQQQHEEFGQQQKLIIDRIVTRQDHFEQQCEELAQLRKMSDRIASQQDCLELRLEEFKQQRKIIDRLVTQKDCCELRNQEMIGCIALKHDYLDRRQDQHHALLMQYVQRASPNQVNPICQKCGDSGYAELLIYCNLCQTSAEHSYCLDKIPKNGDDEIIWTCEDCEQTAEPETRQVVQVTSSK